MKNPLNWLGDRTGAKKAIGSVGGLGALASFIPGPWGVAAGIAGGLLGGSGDQGKADQAAGAQNQIAQQQQAMFNKYTQPALNNLTGFTDPNKNPYSGLADNLFSSGAIGQRGADIFGPMLGNIQDNFGDSAVRNRANSLFDPGSLTGDMVGYQEAGDQAYENAIGEAKGDLANRGFLGPNSLESSAVGSIRQAQGQDNAAARRSLVGNLLAQKRGYLQSGFDTGAQLRTNLANEQSQYRQGQFDTGNNLRTQGVGTALSTNQGLAGFGSNSAQGAIGTFGGLQGMYQNNANQTGQNIGDLVAQASKAGGLKLPKINLGDIFRRKTKPVGTPPINVSNTPGLNGGF